MSLRVHVANVYACALFGERRPLAAAAASKNRQLAALVVAANADDERRADDFVLYADKIDLYFQRAALMAVLKAS